MKQLSLLYHSRNDLINFDSMLKKYLLGVGLCVSSSVNKVYNLKIMKTIKLVFKTLLSHQINQAHFYKQVNEVKKKETEFSKKTFFC